MLLCLSYAPMLCPYPTAYGALGVSLLGHGDIVPGEPPTLSQYRTPGYIATRMLRGVRYCASGPTQSEVPPYPILLFTLLYAPTHLTLPPYACAMPYSCATCGRGWRAGGYSVHPPICLRVCCYAMSGTDLACAAMPCPVLTDRRVVSA
eukprot:335605-Rhodomonas_salina.1